MKKIIVIILFSVVSPLCIAQNIPADWQFMKNDSIKGINLSSATAMLKGKISSPVTVALLNTGIELDNKELKSALWLNPGEIMDNNIDDDKNGYVDDAYGWNFIGSADGSFALTSAGTEAFRVYKNLRAKYKDTTEIDTLSPKAQAEYAYYKQLEHEAGIKSYIVFAEYLGKVASAFQTCDALLTMQGIDRNAIQQDALTKLSQQKQEDPTTALALQVVLQRYALQSPTASWQEVYDQNVSAYELAAQRISSLDVATTDPRQKVGDNLSDFKDLYYGNKLAGLPDSGQGTALAGVIAAQGNNNYRIRGTFPEARIMPVRILPEGDPYDKDVVSGIHYAVDNGAKVILIGFVKNISPAANQVRKALEYAAHKDVLIVQAAGDNKKNNDLQMTFPQVSDRKGNRYPHIVVVGASRSDGLPCSSSSYGKQSVDVFAPGTSYATPYINNQYMQVEGTDVAAAVVAGVAAMIRSYFPKISAAQVRNLLIESAYPVLNDRGNIYFDRCISQGVVDAAKAIELLTSKK